MSEQNFKCHFCPVCTGETCAGELPGLGGVFEGKNNILNCAAWKEIYKTLSSEQIENAKSKLNKKLFRLAPITGAVENVGWHDEESFYAPFVKASFDAGISLAIGDGCPDQKLQLGIAAVQELQNQKASSGAPSMPNAFSTPLAAVYLKPYPQEKLFERVEWASGVAEFIGVDIDSYNIKTMRNKVHLEKKTAADLNELRRFAKKPFVIKGIFTKESLSLVEECKPDVVHISNHGGRIETDIGSTAEFLRENFAFLKNNCGAVWVDGGIRTTQDAITAAALGAEQILLGRPLITAFCQNGATGVKDFVASILE